MQKASANRSLRTTKHLRERRTATEVAAHQRYDGKEPSQINPDAANQPCCCESTLSLLVTRVLANDEQHAATLHELAFIADFLNAGTDFHDSLSRLGAIQSIAVYEESARIHKGLEHDFRHSIRSQNSNTSYLNHQPELGNPVSPRLGGRSTFGRHGRPAARRLPVRPRTNCSDPANQGPQ